MTKKYKLGFTLIELLVVMAIIGILIALAIVGLRAAQSAQQDTARKDIVAQMNAQIQNWIDDKGTAPTVAQFLQGTGAAPTSIMDPTGAVTCTGNTFDVRGTCEGLDGLTGVQVNATAATTCVGTTNAPGTTLYICYTAKSAATGAGYEFGVYENNTQYYAIAQ